MKKREISIIIPCYNVEKYVTKCLTTLEKQLEKYQYEIILINDKSTDDTDKIITTYIKNNLKNIIYINNDENIGAGASRNKAVKLAKYDYISFIDSDDYVDDNYFDEMFSKLENDKSDVVVCDIFTRYNDSTLDVRYPGCYYVPSKYNIINNGLAASPCNKIIKKELLLKYPFAEGIMNEDIPCILSIIVNCKKVSYTDKTAYNYIQHDSSVQNSPLSEKKLDLITAVDMFADIIRDNKDYDLIMEAVIYQQICEFMLYVPIKENNFFKMGKFLTKFGKKTKKYQLRKNKFYYTNINSMGIKIKYFYKITNKLICTGHGYLASMMISMLLLYKKIRPKKSVIKSNITIDDIIKTCQKNQKYSCHKTITVAIPNYNYGRFMLQRLYSILNQNYKINELIILDDCSTDKSRQLIDKIVDNLKPYIDIKKVYNDVNSGSTFKQWKKALELSKSDYLWIAEADDYCKSNMVSSLMKLIHKDDNIRIAYVDTAFIDKEGKIILKTIKPEIDIMKTGHWDHNFINDGKDEIRDYAFLNCTIANVSSALFKKDDYSEIFDQLVEFKQVGDYLFYLSVMEKGKIAFINKPLNYYRLHGSNVTSLTKKQLHFEELKQVHKILDKKYKFNSNQKQELQKRYKFLERVWNLKK